MTNKLEVGMYVRTNLGEIGKVTSVTEDDTGLCLGQFYNSEPFLKGVEIKASFDITDLIETGDYVNGHQVYKVDRECHRITLNGGDVGETFRLTYLRPALGKNMGIKSIVTKEQFEAMQYEVK